MGGVTALGVALARPDLVSALVVANPATSYDRAAISRLAPALPRLPSRLYSSLPSLVTPLFGKPGWFDGLLEEDDETPASLLEDILKRSAALSAALPAAALEWRERELVRAGAREVNALLAARRGVLPWAERAIFVAGGRDFVLPSVDECRRLSRAIGGRVVVEERAAHVILDDVDLVELLATVVPLRRRPHLADETPRISLEPTSDVERLVTAAKKIVSPVFFSTSPDSGAVARGVANVPLPASGPPLIFCGNHQLFGLDGPFIVEALAREFGVLVPSLVHPALLDDVSPISPVPYPYPGTGAMLRRFGCKPAGARSLLAALRGPAKACLVFPGGAREVFKRKGEAYELRWPDDPALVRLAARLNATIVPFSAVGADDGIGTVLLDSDDLLDLPGLGDFYKNRTADLPSFVDGDVFVPPLFLPRPNGPRRMYFLFHRPVTAADYDHDAPALYRALQDTVKDGIARLLDARKRDPFEDNLLARLTYEATVAKAAPSVSLS